MRRDVICGLAIAWIAAAATATEAATTGASGLKFGSVAMDIPVVMYQRLRPLTEYLAHELKRPVTLRLSPDLSAAADEVAAGNVDIAYLTPVAYVEARKKGKVRLVAKTVTKGRSSFKLMIVVRRDSPVRSVAELRGKRFAFGDKAAILQRAVVVNAGIRLEEFESYRFLGHYDNVARGVAIGDFDAGILKDTTAYQWEQNGLRVIYASSDLPPYNIVVSRNVNDRLFRAIHNAFLKLNTGIGGHAEAVKSLDPSYDGFADATDTEYDVVRRLIRPFE